MALDRATQRVPGGSDTACAIDCSLKRRDALTRCLDDGDAPSDNNLVESQVRPRAVGHSNWLFAGGGDGIQDGKGPGVNHYRNREP